jgi:hypothetical protein
MENATAPARRNPLKYLLYICFWADRGLLFDAGNRLAIRASSKIATSRGLAAN